MSNTLKRRRKLLNKLKISEQKIVKWNKKANKHYLHLFKDNPCGFKEINDN